MDHLEISTPARSRLSRRLRPYVPKAIARHETKRTTVDMTWTQSEDRILRDLYPDYKAMSEVLRHRSYSALRNRSKTLGIQKRKHVWTNKDIEKLRSLWREEPAKIRAAFPDMNYAAVIRQGREFGLPKRGRPPFALTGNACCDAIRDRCRELGYSMVDLDRMARTNRYFQSANWASNKQHSLGPMLKAINAPGGTFSVQFLD